MMELGNMIFGNSRGNFPVPRTAAFEGPWNELCEELRLSWRGYPEEENHPLADTNGFIDTPVFRIRSYDWDAECDCGADDKMDDWHSVNEHSSECYQSVLSGAMNKYDTESGYGEADRLAFGGDKHILSGMECKFEDGGDGTVVGLFTPRDDATMDAWRAAYDRRQKFEKELYGKLTRQFGLPMIGCAVHCTCGRDERAKQYWREIGGHCHSCRLIQPNFLYKPTGFHINWYKYPFRDSYMSEKISPQKWREIVRSCIDDGKGRM